MTVPTQVPFSTIPVGDVFSGDLVIYYLKGDANNIINLATGTVSTAPAPETAFTPFPAAKVVLG